MNQEGCASILITDPSLFEGAEYLPNIIQVLDSLPMKPETPWYDAQTACETAIRQQFRGGGCLCRFGITSVIPQRSTQRLAQIQ